MSLESVFPRNPMLVNQILVQGFDLDSLIFACKDLFGVLNDLQLPSLDLCDFITNLKVAHDAKLGKSTHEDYHEIAMKITVTNTLNHRTVYFTLCSNNLSSAKYTCEICAAVLSKNEIKKHVIEHETSIACS